MDYNKIVTDVVLKNLKAFGENRTLRKSVQTSIWTKQYDPVESTYFWKNEEGKIVYEEPQDAVQDISVPMLKDNINNKIVDGKMFLQGDVIFYMRPTVKPVEGDLILENDIVYKIYQVQPVQPASVVLLYTCYARS